MSIKKLRIRSGGSGETLLSPFKKLSLWPDGSRLDHIVFKELLLLLKVIFIPIFSFSTTSINGIDLLKRSSLSFSCPRPQIPFDKLVEGRFSSYSVSLASRRMEIISISGFDIRFDSGLPAISCPRGNPTFEWIITLSTETSIVASVIIILDLVLIVNIVGEL